MITNPEQGVTPWPISQKVQHRASNPNANKELASWTTLGGDNRRPSMLFSSSRHGNAVVPRYQLWDIPTALSPPRRLLRVTAMLPATATPYQHQLVVTTSTCNFINCAQLASEQNRHATTSNAIRDNVSLVKLTPSLPLSDTVNSYYQKPRDQN